MAEPVRTWRIRPWIAVATTAGLVGLLAIQVDVLRRGTSPGNARGGWAFLAVSALSYWLVVVRPRVRVAGGEVELRNPLGTTRFARRDVVRWGFSPRGLVFVLADGRRVTSIVFQATLSWSREPLYFDVIEAVTGERPEPIDHGYEE